MAIDISEIIEKAEALLPIAAEVLPLVIPGSGAAIKVARAIEAVSGVLRFGNTVTKEVVPEIAARLDAIKTEMQAIADGGSRNVPLSIIREVDEDITQAAERIRAALQSGASGASVGDALDR